MYIFNIYIYVYIYIYLYIYIIYILSIYKFFLKYIKNEQIQEIHFYKK